MENLNLEVFHKYYEEALTCIKEGAYDEARSSLLIAGKAMWDGATNADREHQDKYLRVARLLANQIELMTELNGQEQGEESLLGSGRIKATKVQDVLFDDVVGLEEVKELVFDKAINPRKHPELYQQFHIKTGGGILMYGPPGTGKTMIAKAIANEIGATFYAVKCSDLMSKYFGASEKNIRELFDKARSQKSAVIFFDELEAFAADRDNAHNGAMNRIVPELLTQIQGVNEEKKGNTLLLIAATNKPWLIDSAFLRPGRFDERIYVGLPNLEARAELIQHCIEDVPNEDLDVDELAERLEGMNGADITYIVEKAKMLTLKRAMKRKSTEERVQMQDFDKVLKDYKSSVIPMELDRIRRWGMGIA